MEIWGNNYIATLQPLVILQKRVLRIIHGVGFREHTNIFFMESKLLKFKDLVQLQTVPILYRAKCNDLPQNVQKLFTWREGGYVLRGKLNFILPMVHSRKKSFCVSIQE